MLEIAVRIKELTTSNLNALVERAASPAKMLRLLQVELEESIIALGTDAARAARRARGEEAQAAAHDKAAADWQDKARVALAADREDLARAALGEKDRAHTAAAALRQLAKEAQAEAAVLQESVTGLEAKLAEVRERLRGEQAKTDRSAQSAAPTPRSTGLANALHDRISVLEKRIDFATASADANAKAASLDQELAALQREAQLDAELAALKKSLKKGK